MRKSLDVKYYTQKDSLIWGQARRSCQSSANAMVFNHYKPGIFGPGNNADDKYLTLVNSIGDTTLFGSHKAAAKKYGFDIALKTNTTFSDIRDCIDSGRPKAGAILWHGSLIRPSRGHWITFIGYDEKGFIVHDPYGELALIRGRYIPGRNGANLHYSYKNLAKRFFVRGTNAGWTTEVLGVK